MKKRKVLVALVAIALLCCGCGAKYECSRCGDKVRNAYYDPFNTSNYFCEDCAKDYFAPFPYSAYAVD